MYSILKPVLMGSVLLIVGCAQSIGPTATLLATKNSGPPDAEPGVCYGKTTSPAVIETVTEQVLVKASTYNDDGVLLSPAVYHTETLQKIVSPRLDSWFKTPCIQQKTGDFTASLQRALKVRGIYHGRITGELDLRTKRAIRKYQIKSGLDSDTLSLASSRKLGLVAYPREEL